MQHRPKEAMDTQSEYILVSADENNLLVKIPNLQ